MSDAYMDDPAFPVPNDANNNGQPGMTLRQYAAIKLQVPDSGVDLLDAMITKANRDRFAGMALQGFTTSETMMEILIKGSVPIALFISEIAYKVADDMIKAREVKP